jgi:predicted glycoside hydrolase/deacetylase ChbG (UPF0249 family)
MREGGIRGTVALVREWTGKSSGPDVLCQLVTEIINDYPEEDIIEVISHPGYNDQYLDSISSLSVAREDDHRALIELARRGWPKTEGHTLISHSEFPG